MNSKVLCVTETAVMLALLVALQARTKPLGQLVTGSFVNAILAVTVLTAGLYSGLTVAALSPILAYLLGIAPQPLTVPAIMLGNAVFVSLLHFIAGRDRRKILRQVLAWLSAAGAKFATLYFVVVWLFCDLLSKPLLASGTLKEPMLKLLTVTFSWPQLFTALIGGAIALVVSPLLHKALRKL